MQLVLISVGLTFGGMMLSAVFGFTFAVALRTSGGIGNVGFIALMVAMYATMLVSLIMGIVGLAFITAREPTSGKRRTAWDARWLIRRCLWILLGLFILYIALSIELSIRGWSNNGSPLSPLAAFGVDSDDPYRILFGVSGGLQIIIGGLVLPLATLRHLGALLRRTPRRGLVTFARIEFWLFFIGSITMTGGYSVWLVPGMGPMAPVPVSTTGPATTAAALAPGATLTTMVYNPGKGNWTMTSTTSMPMGPPTTMSGTLPANMGWGGFGKPTSTAPVAFVTNPTRPTPVFMITSMVLGLAGCLMMPVGIAGIVLLIMAYRAIRDEARFGTT